MAVDPIRITNADPETGEPKQLRIQIQNTGYVDIDERYRKRNDFDPREGDISLAEGRRMIFSLKVRRPDCKCNAATVLGSISEYSLCSGSSR
jgi:hypothetical protein